MHRREIIKFASKAYETGLTLVPLKMYFKKGKAKLLLGVCRGRKTHDKGEKLKTRSVQRDIQRACAAGLRICRRRTDRGASRTRHLPRPAPRHHCQHAHW